MTIEDTADSLASNSGPSAASKKISRRGLARAAAALAGSAAVATLIPAVPMPAQDHDADGAYLKDQVSASVRKNIAETDSGKVSGYQSGGIVIFKGIPYGGSTAGQNRFMPPTRPAPWTGVRTSLHWGPVSPQPYTNTLNGRRGGWKHDDEAFMFEWDDGQGSEDCLRVNVWTPALDNKKRPVMFWIHGGQFTTGSSNELAAYEGENIARRGDVVVVSMNHRLGSVGYLNLMEYGDRYASSANAGMLDIVAALQWVQTNISNFGGDPGKVMIFGQSGGARKTSVLLGMPATKGLVHRASIQSSDPYSMSKPDFTAGLANALVKELGLTRDSIGKIHDLPIETIIEASYKVGPGNPWIATIDGKILPHSTWDPSAPEGSADVPVMLGSVLNEMANSIQMGDASLENMPMDEVKRRLTPRFKDKTDSVVAVFQQVHPKATPFDIYSYIGGVGIRTNLIRAATAKTTQGKAPAYLYLFQWQTPVLDGRPRSYHCSELPFVFYNTDRCATMTGGGPAPLALGAKMADAWISFARNGNPNHAGLPKWPAFTDAVPTMVFDNTCEVKNNHDAAERKAIESAS